MPWGLILKLGPYALILLALAWGGFEHTWRVTLQRDAATEVAVAQAKVAAFKEADAIKAKELQDAHAAEVTRLKEQSNARETSIARALSSKECLATPAARAFLNGLQQPDKAATGAADPAARAGAPLSVRIGTPVDLLRR